MVMLADQTGGLLAWSSSGLWDSKEPRKPLRMQQPGCARRQRKGEKYGLRELEVFVRELAADANHQSGLWLTRI